MLMSPAASFSSTPLVSSQVLALNHLLIFLMTSKLIYKRFICMAKNGTLIAGFLSALTPEDVSTGPLGVMALW